MAMYGVPTGQPDPIDVRPENIPDAQGLVRQRLITHLTAASATGLALVVAPAGYGKTTLLAQYASAHRGPVAWHGIDAVDAATGHAARRLTEVVLAATPDALLVIDNVDQLIGTSAEGELERLLPHRARGGYVLLAGRRMPELNLLRHEVSGVPGVIGPDQLRFRTWEVERLLATVYGEPLPPDEVALLTRRTGGWAAGLAMFHLSTRGRPLVARQRAVASLSGRWSMARGYLARTLLTGLAPDARTFLVRTSVLDVLTGERCDRLLDTTGSDRVLDDLATRYGLPITVDGGHSYLYHQVLRSHLAAALVEDLGESRAAKWHARAAKMLVAEGAYPEAVRAYARAGDWSAVRKLLAKVGDVVADTSDSGLGDLLPAWLLAEDPWLVYAEARRRMGHGQIEAAIASFRKAEALFGDEDGKHRCGAERRTAAIWLSEEVPQRAHWSAWLRAAVRRHPTIVGGQALALPGASGELIRLVTELLAGDVRDALRCLRDTRTSTPVESTVPALSLRLLRTALTLAVGGEIGIELDRIADEAESEGFPWLSRMARAARSLGTDPETEDEAYAVAAECDRRGDRWGALLATGISCLRDWRFGTLDPHVLARLTQDCRTLGAGVLQAWAQALLALAGGVDGGGDGPPDADLDARTAAHLAASAGVPGAHIIATLALARCDHGRREVLLAEVMAQAATIGMPLPAHALADLAVPSDPPADLAGSSTPPALSPAFSTLTVPAAIERGAPAPASGPTTAAATGTLTAVAPAADQPPPVSIRCFGGFRMEISGRSVEIMTVRARARSALRLLATHAGQVVHKEVLIEALWPDLSVTAATRNLQVTISALRGLLEPTSERGKAQLLIRSGEAYGIALPPGGFCDTVAFVSAVDRWKRIHRTGDKAAEVEALRAALAAYPAELLPEEGPTDWAVEARDRFHRQATSAARALAVVELELGNITEAVSTAEYCLSLDQHDDEAWQVLIRAYTAGGALAKAAEVRQGYTAMLTSLGLSDADARQPSTHQPSTHLAG